MLTALLRTCPRSTGPAAARVCGISNWALHDPNRPTFGQLAPLLHAFIDPDTGGIGGGSSNGGASVGVSKSSGGGGGASVAVSKSSSSSSSGGGGSGGSGDRSLRSSLPQPLIVAHNGGFDARMLIGEWVRCGLPVPQSWRLLDTLPLARAYVQDCANFQQGTLRQRFGVALAPGEAEHDAGTDAAVLAQLLPHIVQAASAGGLGPILDGRVRKANGELFHQTLGDLQARMRGAAGGSGAAEASAFTCPFCHARVVE